MIRTRTQSVVLALARIPRSGTLHNNIRAESAVLSRKLRPLLHEFRLGSVIYALFTLAAEYATQLLKAETNGCDCILDRKNGLFKCTSNRHHAVTDIVIIEEKPRHAKHR
jgi:hypothetical protein